MCACCCECPYTSTCYDQTCHNWQDRQYGNACRRADSRWREAEALIAKDIRQESIKEVKGKRAAGWIAAWADIRDELDRADGNGEWDTNRNGDVWYQRVDGRLAIAVAYWEDWWALWWECDRRATERWRWRWNWNVVWTWRAELRQYFQFDFCFYLDLYADNDVELNHATEENSTGW